MSTRLAASRCRGLAAASSYYGSRVKDMAGLCKPYAAATLVAVPSYNESFGLVAVEAQAGEFIDFAQRVVGRRLEDGWDAVVLFLGTNFDGNAKYFEDSLRETITAFGPTPFVVLTTAEFRSSQRVVNEIIRRIALDAFGAHAPRGVRVERALQRRIVCSVLLWQLPWQRRVVFGGMGTVAVIAAAAVLLRERLQANAMALPGGGFLASLLYDVGPQRATDTSRFYELEAAAHSLQGSWLFGLGSWGSFRGNEEALDYHFGKFDFVHSGFGHLVLKSGVAGLLLFVALLAAVVLHYGRTRPSLRGNSALLADAGMASLLFWLPTLLVGTPVIEFRTMLLIGLTLAMPYLAARAHHPPLTHRAMPPLYAPPLKARPHVAP